MGDWRQYGLGFVALALGAAALSQTALAPALSHTRTPAKMADPRVALTDGSRWKRKLWAVLMLLSRLVILYVAWRFGLFAMTVHY